MNQNDLTQIRTVVKQEVKSVIKEELKPIKKDISALQSDISSIKETVEFTKESVINLLDWTQDIHEAVTGTKSRIRSS